jgi:hypothetical protein
MGAPIIHSGFGLAFAIALEHSVWGFFCKNPCEKLSGEISTHLVPQLGLEDERLLHTILVSGLAYRGRFNPAYPEGMGPFRQLGFVYRGKTISLRDFLEGYHHSTFFCRLGCHGAIVDVL